MGSVAEANEGGEERATATVVTAMVVRRCGDEDAGSIPTCVDKVGGADEVGAKRWRDRSSARRILVDIWLFGW